MIKGNVRHRTKLCIPTNQVPSTNVIFTRILLLIEVRAELLFPQARSIERLSLCACFFILFGSKKQEYRRRTDLNADWDLDVKYATHESDCRKFFCRFCCLGPLCSDDPILFYLHLHDGKRGIVILLKLPWWVEVFTGD